jgi:hypothetical protein
MNGYERARPWGIGDEFRIWRYGRPEPIWVVYNDIVENAISELKLSPLDKEHYPIMGLGREPFVPGAQYAQAAQTGQQQVEKIKIPDFPGGLKCPHLHHKRDIYLLNDEQWKAFSNNIIKGFSAKLSQIGTVSFEQLLQTSEAISALT